MDKIYTIFIIFSDGRENFISAWKNRKDAKTQAKKLGSRPETETHFGYDHKVKTIKLRDSQI